MEPERPIEKLLRAFAKKRRADAGVPLEPHPATRRMLQSEVARQFPKPAVGGAKFARVRVNWWQRLAWAVSALVVLGLGVWSLVPTREKSKATIELAKNTPAPATSASDNFKPLEAPPQPAAPPAPIDKLDQPALAYDDTSRAQAEGKTLGYDAEKLDFKKDRALEVAPVISGAQMQARHRTASTPVAGANAPEPGSAGGGGFGGGGGGQGTGNRITTFTAAGSPAAMPPPGLAGGVADTLGDEIRRRAYNGMANRNTGMLRQNFVQAQSRGQFKAAAKLPESTQVLAAFQVEQAGNQLRVIDNDGSTYTGGVELAAGELFSNTATDREEVKLLKTDGNGAARNITAKSASNAQAAQNYFFRVAGTNRTLNQQVVFSGNFLEAAQMETNRWQNVGTSQLQQSAPMLLNSTIFGRAQVGDQKEIQINAVPAAP